MSPFARIFSLCWLVAMTSAVLAGEPVAVAGKIVRSSDSTGSSFIGLVSSRTLAVIAFDDNTAIGVRAVVRVPSPSCP